MRRAFHRRSLVVVSDLDGTLLDSRTYSYAAARSSLALVKRRAIPLVFCSSKTRAEIERYRRRLGNAHPFICENGGGTLVPIGHFPFRAGGSDRDGYEVISLGIGYEQVRMRFAAVRDRVGIAVRGFGDMDDAEVAALTGLPMVEARLARQREYSEPIVLPDECRERFLREAEREGLRWTQGRLFHLMGDHDKGRALDVLRALYERRDGSVTIIAIGDSLNDLPMLRAADRAVLVRNAGGVHDARVDFPGLVRADGIGPVGWGEAIQELVA